METIIKIKEDSHLIREGATLVEVAEKIKIVDDLTMSKAVEIALTLKAFLDEGPGTYHDEDIDVANKLHKSLCSKRNAIRRPAEAAYKVIKDLIATYKDTQERKRIEAQRRAEEEAQEKEREKQAKIQAKIDEENRKIEVARQEEDRKQRERDAEIEKTKNKKKAEEMRRNEEDRRVEQERIDRENADKVAEENRYREEKKENVYVAPAVVPKMAAQKGVGVKYSYDPLVVTKALVPECYKTVDLPALKKAQGAAKGGLVIPGVRFIKRPIGSLRK